MSRLLENLLRNRQQEKLNEFDMTKSGTAMMRHLGGNFPYDSDDSLPIEPENANWQQLQLDDKICLQKTYELDSVKFLTYFVNELIHLSEEMYHHPDILISHTQVTVTLFTRDLNDVTDRDIQMSKKIDEIIEDINVIKFRA
jgi:pterin-4a-carbinolamine dehydratase